MIQKTFNASPIEGKWEEQKKRFRQKYSGLTDRDLYFEAGSMDKMFERLQIKLGKTKMEMHRLIEHFGYNF